MKRKRIINSLDSILPDKSSKDQILNNILAGNCNKKSINYKLLIPIASCIFILTLTIRPVIVDNKIEESSNIPATIRSVSNEIIYNGICYQENGIFRGDTSKLIFVEETNEFMMGNKIYKIDEAIVFQNNENYIEFIRCERN